MRWRWASPYGLCLLALIPKDTIAVAIIAKVAVTTLRSTLLMRDRIPYSRIIAWGVPSTDGTEKNPWNLNQVILAEESGHLVSLTYVRATQ